MKRRIKRTPEIQDPKRKLRYRYHTESQNAWDDSKTSSHESADIENCSGSNSCAQNYGYTRVQKETPSSQERLLVDSLTSGIHELNKNVAADNSEKSIMTPVEDMAVPAAVDDDLASGTVPVISDQFTKPGQRFSISNSENIAPTMKELQQQRGLVKKGENLDASILEYHKDKEELHHDQIDDDTDDETLKDNVSRCSESDTNDRSYRVNVGLYGTDLDEDCTRDEDDSMLTSKGHDVNNNQPGSIQQVMNDSQCSNNLDRQDPVTSASLRDKLMDEGSNTVDGFTRRALESHCKIVDNQVEFVYKGQSNPLAESPGPLSPSASEIPQNHAKKSDVNSANSSSFIREQNHGSFPTDFAGAFRQGITAETSNHGNCCNPANLPQSFNNYYPPQDVPYCKPNTPNIFSPRYGIGRRPGLMTSPLTADANIAAEQLASELVQTYSGENSAMISDMLRRRAEGHFCGPDQNASDQRQFEDLTSTQTVIHDVDLLNTPQQLTPVENDYTRNQCFMQGDGSLTQHHTNSAQTPESHKTNMVRGVPQELQGRMTYNDIQVYGGKWSVNRQETATHPSYNQDYGENPFPNQPEAGMRNFYGSNDENPQSPSPRFINNYSGSNPGVQAPSPFPQSYNDYSQFNLESHVNKARCSPQIYAKNHFCNRMGSSYPFSPDPLGLVGGIGDCPRPSHEVTKMTYTPRNVMESHLSQNGQYVKSKVLPNQPISDVDYSSIYPPRDYIDRHLTEGDFSRKKDRQTKSSDATCQRPPKKRYKPSKYDLQPLRAPPMPIFDEMMSKYPPPFSKETEPLNARHKYVVVNPSPITEMSSKTLLLKYIDFLILENEQITDISQSPGAPEDIFVTEDMYFMDTLKNKVPFPSKKFTEWVASFFPKLDFNKMKFKGRYPILQPNADLKICDPRSTQQVLEDTFYFFQRTVMNLEG